MKQIPMDSTMKFLVPTDFSDASIASVNLAIELAIKHKATIHLMHCEEPKKALKGARGIQEYKDDFSQADSDQAYFELGKIKLQMNERGISCYVHNECGNFIKCMIDLSESICPDLIIIGSNAYKRTSDWLFTSSSKSIVNSVKSKVLIIDEQQTASKYEDVLFVLHGKNTDTDKVLDLIIWLGALGLERVHFISTLQKPDEKNRVTEEIERRLPNVAILNHRKQPSVKTDQFIYDLIEKENIPLVVLQLYASNPIEMNDSINLHDILSNSHKTAVLTC